MTPNLPAVLQEIVFFEEGEPLMDGEPGDLRFVVRTRADPRFQRDGADLRHNLTISLVDALTGFSTEVPCHAHACPGTACHRHRTFPAPYPSMCTVGWAMCGLIAAAAACPRVVG